MGRGSAGFLGVVVLLGVRGAGSGVVLVLAAAAFYGLGALLVSRRFPDTPSLTVVAGMLLLAAVPLIPLALVLELFPAPTATALLSIMVLGVLCTAGGFAACFALITAAGPARAALITYVAPIVAGAAGAVILHEPITTHAILGVVVILLGVALATRRPRTPELKLKMEHR